MIQNTAIQKIEQILVIIATLAVIYVNYLAGTGQINNTTPQEISDKYMNLLTPAGYAFSIWGLIYLGLSVFSIFQALPSQKANTLFQRIRTFYLASCAANIAWLYSWHYENILLSMGLMLVILLTMILINRILYFEKNNQTIVETLLVQIPFGIYFGWITAAAILNATIALMYIGVKFEHSLSVISACFMIAAAAILAVLIRRRFDNSAYPLTIAWALTAIGIKQQTETAIFAAAIIGAIIAVLSIFLPKKDFTKLK